MRFLVLFLLVGCGTTLKVKGGTENHASSESTINGRVEVVVRIDISSCMLLPPEDQLECVVAIADSLEDRTDVENVLFCVRDIAKNARNESPDTPESCREFLPVEEGNTGS